MEQSLPDYIRVSLLGTGGRPQPASKEFRTRCYTAARGTGGRIVGWDPPSFGFLKSFTATVFQFPQASGDALVFLLTTYSGSLLACASARDERNIRYPLTFIDFPGLTAPFQYSYHILTKQELEHPWMWTEQELAASLSPHMLKDINYWQPRTVGDVIFNCWD